MITRAPRCRSIDGERGFVIVAVLWLLAALAALALIFSLHLVNSTRAVALNDTALQAEALVSAGVELTAYQLRLASEQARPARGALHTQLNRAELSVSFISEAARIDLNAAPKELLARLLSVLGASSEDAKQYSDRIVGWRTRATPETADKEDALYLAGGRSYLPRQAPFAHVNELGLVLGLPPALVERMLPFVTVFSGAPGVDVLNAAPEVIAALPGVTPLVLNQFLNERDSLPNDPTAIATALGGSKENAILHKSQAYRLEVRVRFPNGQRAGSEVVISLSGDEDPYRVLSWQDEVRLQPRAAAQF
jgi:general secretion pathway protein K